MGKLIDTNILIEAERGRLDITTRVAESGSSQFFLSVISVSELLHGVHRANDPAIKDRRLASTEYWITELPVIPIDLAIARTHAALWAKLEVSGQVIGIHDLWLAATCLNHQLGIVTHNVREFDRVPGLLVERW